MREAKFQARGEQGELGGVLGGWARCSCGWGKRVSNRAAIDFFIAQHRTEQSEGCDHTIESEADLAVRTATPEQLAAQKAIIWRMLGRAG